jgi:hypothetical protein
MITYLKHMALPAITNREKQEIDQVHDLTPINPFAFDLKFKYMYRSLNITVERSLGDVTWSSN